MPENALQYEIDQLKGVSVRLDSMAGDHPVIGKLPVARVWRWPSLPCYVPYRLSSGLPPRETARPSTPVARSWLCPPPGDIPEPPAGSSALVGLRKAVSR